MSFESDIFAVLAMFLGSTSADFFFPKSVKGSQSSNQLKRRQMAEY